MIPMPTSRSQSEELKHKKRHQEIVIQLLATMTNSQWLCKSLTFIYMLSLYKFTELHFINLTNYYREDLEKEKRATKKIKQDKEE